ncbi:MAG: PA0069 family radical SAM protein [Saprospiraceae bacterium]|nr:PA0069 family radical SAM protein [Saprospiraceae bacterium]
MRFDLPIVHQAVRGRGAQINTPNPYANEIRDAAPWLFMDEEDATPIKTKFVETHPKSIVNKVESPDVGMEYSLNPYQGCEHGCVYCYARTTHVYWGYSAGLEFESVVLVKKNAPDLLEKLLQRKSWKASPVMLSGNTDCYQPVEKELGITRKLLEVFLKYKHPVGIVTKNALILRDLDLLKELNKHNLISVAISMNTLDDDLRRVMEPRTSSTGKRLETIRLLSGAGIPVTVLAAPIIPGLNDTDILPLAKKVAEAGARRLSHIVVRLNGDVAQIFSNWLDTHFSERKEKVLNKIRNMHQGELGSVKYKERMTGSGKIADIIHQQFHMAKRLYMLDGPAISLNTALYNQKHATQLQLFS